VKWFQVDSDTPNDPRIKAILREMGAEGVGGLFLLWCFIADHGCKPGRSIDSSNRPFPVADLIEATRLDKAKFERLVTICTDCGHFTKDAWVKRQEIAIPAMLRRADTYTRRTHRTK
jgi:hypothetical protein